MLLHEFLQHILFLLLIARRLPLPLHLLIIHHLLHHTPRLAVQIRQLAVFRDYFRDVDLGCGCDDVRPPVRAGGFGEGERDGFARGLGDECPGAVVDDNWVWEVALGAVSVHLCRDRGSIRQ
jgi:hypothetical protein